jgi:universal stress protein A
LVAPQGQQEGKDLADRAARPLVGRRRPAQAAAMPKIQKILVPTDFSPVSPHVIQYAGELAQTFGASLLVVHVVPPSAYPMINVAGMGHFPNLREEIRKRCEHEMAELLAKTHPDVQPTSHIVEGVPFAEILSCAKAENVDLIVMATHGHTGLKHLVLGSTAERVVRMATCPVLTVRTTE